MEPKVSLTPQEKVTKALNEHLKWLKNKEAEIASKKRLEEIDLNLHVDEHSTSPLSHPDTEIPDFKSKASGEGLDRELEMVDGEWKYKETTK